MPRKSAAKPAAKPAVKPAAKPAEVKPAAKSAAKPAKKTSKKTSKETTSTPVQEVMTVPVDSVVEAPAEKSPIELIEEQFQTLTTRLVELRSMETSLMSELKALHRSTLKHMKTMSKKKKRVVGDKKDRVPSGFAKPTKMSQQLCQFLGKPEGTEMARTEVTKYITKYVKENDLQNPENRREIKCDTKLKTLLNVDDSVPVTYFNLQKYMKVHFMKSEPAVVV